MRVVDLNCKSPKIQKFVFLSDPLARRPFHGKVIDDIPQDKPHKWSWCRFMAIRYLGPMPDYEKMRNTSLNGQGPFYLVEDENKNHTLVLIHDRLNVEPPLTNITDIQIAETVRKFIQEQQSFNQPAKRRKEAESRAELSDMPPEVKRILLAPIEVNNPNNPQLVKLSLKDLCSLRRTNREWKKFVDDELFTKEAVLQTIHEYTKVDSLSFEQMNKLIFMLENMKPEILQFEDFEVEWITQLTTDVQNTKLCDTLAYLLMLLYVTFGLHKVPIPIDATYTKYQLVWSQLSVEAAQRFSYLRNNTSSCNKLLKVFQYLSWTTNPEAPKIMEFLKDLKNPQKKIEDWF